MIEKKLEALFNMLDEDEIKTVESSEINTECDIDPTIHTRITSAVAKKTMPAEITVISAVKKRSMGKRLKAILIAAAIFIVLTIGVGATYQFIMPDRLTEELALNAVNIRTVVDSEKADKNNVRTVQKTVKTNGYTVNFEAIIDGYVILPEIVKQFKGFDTDEEIREDRIYAVMTITRDDGKNVISPDGYMPVCSCCGGYNINFTVAVKGYAPSPVMFNGTPWYYQENNVLYYLCDITDAAKFADRNLSIIIAEGSDIDGTIARMDKNGAYYFVDTFDGMGAIFDFDLDDSLADAEAVSKDMAERPYIYVTNPDYTIADEMIAKDEELKKVDLSYAIGNHRWYGWDPLQFGDIPYAESFTKLCKNKSELTETDAETFGLVIDDATAAFEKAYIAEIEKLAGKSFEELSDDELNSLAFETEEIRAELVKVKADFLREKLEFIKLEGFGEYCHINNYAFLFIPENSEYTKIVIVYGDRIVLSVDCTVDNLNNIFINRMQENTLCSDMYAYWYLFGVDEDYKELFDEESFNAVTGVFRTEQDAIFSLVTEFRYYDGTVEVLR